MPISLNSSTDSADPGVLALASQTRQTQDQVNANKMTAVRSTGGDVNLRVPYRNGNLNVTIPANVRDYVSLTITDFGATNTDLPDDGDYGWHQNDISGDYSFNLNVGGSIVTIGIGTLSGSITAFQHGNLSGTGTTMHDFPEIGGTITDAQHGNRSGGSLHSAATTSVAGFLSASDKTTYDGLVTTVASLNAIVTDITSTGTPTHLVNGTGLYVNGVHIIFAQGSGYSVAGGVSIDKSFSGLTGAATYDPAQMTQLSQWVGAMFQLTCNDHQLG